MNDRMCDLDDCQNLVLLVAEELNVGYMLRDTEDSVNQRRRLARHWHRRLGGFSYQRARAAVTQLADNWEKDRMPRPKEVEDAVRRLGLALTPDTKRYLDWHDRGLGDDEPCPICKRPATRAPLLRADCDPFAHFEVSVPLVGCHNYLHEATNYAKRRGGDWPTHDQAYDWCAPEGPMERARAVGNVGTILASLGFEAAPGPEVEAKRAAYHQEAARMREPGEEPEQEAETGDPPPDYRQRQAGDR